MLRRGRHGYGIEWVQSSLSRARSRYLLFHRNFHFYSLRPNELNKWAGIGVMASVYLNLLLIANYIFAQKFRAKFVRDSSSVGAEAIAPDTMCKTKEIPRTQFGSLHRSRSCWSPSQQAVSQRTSGMGPHHNVVAMVIRQNDRDHYMPINFILIVSICFLFFAEMP